MFKAVQNLREQKGFTLIELLIVIAIIGILAAIAIPAFLGQREKAKQRALESSARAAVSEVQAALDDYISKTAMVFLELPGKQKCYHYQSAITKRNCDTLYPDLKANGYKTYADLGDVLEAVLTHHNDGKEEQSPYDGTDLFTNDSTKRKAHVLLLNTSDSAALLQAWSDTDINIFNAPISAR